MICQVAYNFSLPYEKKIQKDGLVYPVVFWRDAEKGVSRMDTFGGRNILISTKVCRPSRMRPRCRHIFNTLHTHDLSHSAWPSLSAPHKICLWVQDKEIEIVPRLQKLVCKINKPDADDEPLIDAPVRDFSFAAHSSYRYVKTHPSDQLAT